MPHNGIHSSAYQRARAAKRAEWKRMKRRCAICGEPIDYDLPNTDPQHFQLDHIKPRDKFPELEFEPSNWQATHGSCNKHKSNGQVPASIGQTSERW